jgi:hypothetical protein
MNALADQKNIDQFVKVVRKAYAVAKGEGLIPAREVSIYDKLAVCPAVVTEPASFMQPARTIQAHRVWRRRVAQMYRRQHGISAGPFDFNLDWESVWNWLLENIVPILKVLIMIVPFLL